ncbi:MAG: hypothetical protein F4Y80_17000 [Caldilineaceae bacterium SB0665_bin_21]|nr:hypothetical protein [Caldilineaceae bacterium SB0665_bin_21]MYA06293.1 hypothetical protein [Caldilineaceae bacterium SB0664_bin_22]MYC64402.1 hypothetical protein [Caldilineaceae bacterium SB0661_bin_34]
MADLYVPCVSFRGLSRLLARLGCGVGAATLWRDVQAVVPGLAPDPWADLPLWVEVDETWLSIGGEERPVAGWSWGRRAHGWTCASAVPASTGAAGSQAWPRAGCRG